MALMPPPRASLVYRSVLQQCYGYEGCPAATAVPFSYEASSALGLCLSGRFHAGIAGWGRLAQGPAGLPGTCVRSVSRSRLGAAGGGSQERLLLSRNGLRARHPAANVA